jgi:hypothetical protein
MPDQEIQENVISHAQTDLANVPGATGSYEHQEPSRLSLGAIASETIDYMTDSFIPQGRDELAKAVLGGMDGYWPGNNVGTTPDTGGGVHGAAMEPMGGSVYGDSQVAPPEPSYEQQLAELASREQSQQDIGIGY